MPRYDYVCPECGQEREVYVPFEESQRTTIICKLHCGNVEMVKKPSAPAFVVKGFNARNGYSGGQK